MTRFPILFFVLISAGLMPLAAQEAPAIRAELDKKTILLGEPLQLRIEARYPEGKAAVLSLPDSLKGFESLGDPERDSGSANGMRTLTLVYRLTSFDSGHKVIPSFRLGEWAASDTIGVDVVFTEFNPEQPYHDIKDVADVKQPRKKPVWWIAGGALLLLLLILYLFLRKKKKEVTPLVTAPLDAYRDALRELEELDRQQPASRLFYAGLTDIFRRYLSRRSGIRSMQDTTAGLVRQLKGTGLPVATYDELTQVLLLADFVKFAKYEPAPAENRQSLALIRQSIEEMEKIIKAAQPSPNVS